jgi:hypothetical protein
MELNPAFPRQKKKKQKQVSIVKSVNKNKYLCFDEERPDLIPISP